MKEKILLIGRGWIGGRVATQLTDIGFEVTALDLVDGFDLRTQAIVNHAIEKFEGTKVVLIAAIADLNVFEGDPQNGFDVNMVGVWNVALACTRELKTLYYISTCCVYGNTTDLPSTESMARPEPSEIYAACKLAGEWIIKGLHRSYGLQYNILRIATCFGPGMRSALAPAVFINQLTRGEEITVHGSGEQTRTYTYIDDEVDGICRVISLAPPNNTYNVSTSEEVSVNEMVSIIQEEYANVFPRQGMAGVTHIPDRIGQTYKEQVDSSRLKALGWDAHTSFREGVIETLEWMKKEGLDQI